MGVERNPPPKPTLTPAPQWVGPVDMREDVSTLTERGICVRALDVVLRLQHIVESMRAGLRLEMDEVKEQLRAIETGRPTMPSHHDWSEDVARMEELLKGRVKDPRDPMTSDRVRTLIQATNDAIADKKDATLVRRIKAQGWALGLEVGKAVLFALLGAAAAKWGLHL